jgi:hypothetical protein
MSRSGLPWIIDVKYKPSRIVAKLTARASNACSCTEPAAVRWQAGGHHGGRRPYETILATGRHVMMIVGCGSVLDDLRTYKIPALQQAKIDVSGAQIVLLCKSGFTPALEQEANATGVRLVRLEQIAQ